MIRAGGYSSDRASDPTYPGGLSTTCLNANGVDSNSLSVTVSECNGSPYQTFMLSHDYNIANLTEGMPYTGAILVADGTYRKCLDGTGNVLTVQICTGSDEQIWGHCRTRATYGPYSFDQHSNCPRSATGAPEHSSVM